MVSRESKIRSPAQIYTDIILVGFKSELKKIDIFILQFST